MKEELLVLAEGFGCKYSKILDRMDETGDFTEATAAEEAFADQILARFKAKIEKVKNPFPTTRQCADEDGAIRAYINFAHTQVEDFRHAILKELE